MKIELFLALTLGLVSLPSFAQDPKSQADTVPAIPKVSPISAFAGQTFQAVESNGEIMFITPNGRFVIRGQLIDTWAAKTLDTPEEIKYAATHINIEQMGLPVDQMNTVTIGSGPKKVYLFVDPLCSYCKTLLQQAQQNSSLYTFTIFVVPALGDESNALSKKLFCSTDRQKGFNALLDRKLGELPQQQKCDTKKYDLTLLMAQNFGINRVPFIVAPDGRTRFGGGTEFWDWVKGSDKKIN